MKTLTALTVLAFVAFGSVQAGACGGMTTVNPPPIVFDDPVAAPTFDEEDPEELGDGECIL